MTAVEYINSKRDVFLSDLRRLTEINSVRAQAKPGMPFGEGCAAVLREAESILSEHGYKMTNYGNYAGEADLGKEPCLMLLAHLDVVPEGDGWTREPFRLTLEDGKAYGRGTTDDKGAALACLLAMDACREAYGEPEKGVRLVLGCGEETGSEDMEHYFSVRPKLGYTLSPDADYPLINIEKGRFAPHFYKKISDSSEKSVLKIIGGDTDNIVPGKARAVLRGFSFDELKPLADETAAETGTGIVCEPDEENVTVLVKGKSAHAANPFLGINAQTALLKLLSVLPFDESVFPYTAKDLLKLFPHGETDGKCAGVKMSDTEAGELTLNFGVMSYDGETLSCGLDLRCPLCANDENVKKVLKEKLAAIGFAFEGEPSMRPAHCVPADSPLVKTVLGVYEKHTGQKGECLAIGGGTYVHDIEGGVAFGIEFPGKDYRIHGADEFCDVDEMLLTAAMYADVIKELCY